MNPLIPFHAPKMLDALSQEAEQALAAQSSLQFYIKAATSQNTRRSYQADIRHFYGWGGKLPATTEMLLQYLQTYAALLNPKTLKRRLIAIKHWHTFHEAPDPTAHPLVKKAFSGILHVHGKPAEKAKPLSAEQLTKIADILKQQTTLANSRNNALLQTGFFGAFRRSELTALCWEHITYVPQGMEILIPRSKTDQEGIGEVIALPYGNHLLCPVNALKEWQIKLSSPKTGPVFCRLLKNQQPTRQALSTQSVNTIIKSVAKACQLPDAENYSGHSLRRGFATTASQQGATLGSIMRQGRWRNETTVHGYIQEGQRFESNAATKILENLTPAMVLSITQDGTVADGRD